jgi:uncharacterized protein (TIRG00374 family)
VPFRGRDRSANPTSALDRPDRQTILGPMRPPSKSTLVTLVKFAVPAAIIGYLLRQLDWQEFAAQPKNFWLLTAALLVALTAVSLSFTRWCLLVRCQGIELGMLEGFRLCSIGFLLNLVAPGSVGGDLFKAVFLARRRPGKRIAAVASVLVDRGCGLYGLLVVVSVALLLTNPTDAAASQGSSNLEWIKIATAALIGSGTLVLAILVFGGRGVDRLVTWGSSLPAVGGLIAKIGPPLRMFHSHPVAFGVAIVMSVGVHFMFVISLYLIACGLYSSPPTLAEHFVIGPIGLLASTLPFTPGGIGVLEAAMEWLYEIVPAVPTAASGTLVALAFEMVKVVMAVFGTVFYWTANKEERESLEIAEDQVAEHGEEESSSPAM